MKALIIPIILISVVVSAQKKKQDPQKKNDTVKIIIPKDSIHFKEKTILDRNKTGALDKMPVAKPKDTSIYSALKEPKKDTSKYKILNAIPTEKPENKTKK